MKDKKKDKNGSMGESAETIPLLREHTVKSVEGSNPSASAKDDPEELDIMRYSKDYEAGY